MITKRYSVLPASGFVAFDVDGFLVQTSQPVVENMWLKLLLVATAPFLIILLITLPTRNSRYRHVEQIHYNIRTFNATEVIELQLKKLEQEARATKTKYYPDLYPLYFPHPNKIVQQIPAAQKFTVEYITKYSKPFENVYKHSQKTFVFYDTSKPLLQNALAAEKGSLHPFSISQDMSTKEFFNKLKTETGPYYYFSKSIKYLGETIQNDIESFTKEFMVTQRDKSINIWIGGSGSTAQTHYDATHNMYIQLRGTKRFRLFEPAAWRFLNLYPYLHPYSRQSQIEIEQVPLEGHYVGPFDITLHEGDILYIPPYWFHHVEAIGNETSISINIWTGCDESDAHWNIQSAPLPFESDWTQTERMLGVKAYLSIVLNEMLHQGREGGFVLAYKDARDYIKQVIGRKYNHLIQNKIVPSKITCPKGFDKVDRKFNQYAQKVVDIALRVTPRIRDILVGHWLEEVAQWAVGGEYAGAFLMNCF